MVNLQDKDILYVNKSPLHKNLSNTKLNNSKEEKSTLMYNHLKKVYSNLLPDNKWIFLSIKMTSNPL